MPDAQAADSQNDKQNENKLDLKRRKMKELSQRERKTLTNSYVIQNK